MSFLRTMQRKLAWLLICIFVGVCTYPLADFALWHMRSRFIPGYADSKILCERKSLLTITDQLEKEPGSVTQLRESLAQTEECVELLQTLDEYRTSLPQRSLFLAVVVFLATFIVRFVMFPVRRHKKPRRTP